VAAPSDRCVEVRRAIGGPEPIGRRRSPVRPGCASGRARLVNIANHRRATATVTWCGCRRGDSSRGTNVRRGECARPEAPVRPESRRRIETRRTPGSAAGCNKPATSGDGKPSRWCETTRAEPFRVRRFGTTSGGNTGRDPVPEGQTMEGRTGESQERRPAEPDFGPVESARAERRLRRGGEGHGGAADRVTDRASAVGRPRRPVPGGARRQRAVDGNPHGTTAREGAGKTNDPLPRPSSGHVDRTRSKSGSPVLAPGVSCGP
jgi:hypothetical protein